MLKQNPDFSYIHIGSVNIEELESILTKVQISMISDLYTEMLNEIKTKIRKNAYCHVYYSKDHNAFVLEPWGEVSDV